MAEHLKLAMPAGLAGQYAVKSWEAELALMIGGGHVGFYEAYRRPCK